MRETIQPKVKHVIVNLCRFVQKWNIGGGVRASVRQFVIVFGCVIFIFVFLQLLKSRSESVRMAAPFWIGDSQRFEVVASDPRKTTTTAMRKTDPYPTNESSAATVERLSSSLSTFDEKCALYVDYFRHTERRPYAHRIVVKPTPLCDDDGDGGPLVVIAVLSHPTSFAERSAIRETWGSFVDGEPWPITRPANSTSTVTTAAEVRLVFVLGLEKPDSTSSISEA